MRRVLGLVLGSVLLAVAGCGADNGNAGNTGNGGEGGDATAWADKVCQSVEGEIDTLTKGPKVDTSTPEAARDGLTSFLDDFGTALDRLIGGIEAAGTPPVADGQRIVDETTSDLDQAKETIQNARTKLDQVDVSNPDAARQAFTEVAQDMEGLGKVDATDNMENHPELKAAFEQAPTCQKLDAKATSSPPTS